MAAIGCLRARYTHDTWFLCDSAREVVPNATALPDLQGRE